MTTRWIFHLEWRETIADGAAPGGSRELEIASPIGPYLRRSDAEAARARYLADRSWLPEKAHSPAVSEIACLYGRGSEPAA